MPRRKPVSAQPKLKHEDDQDGTETGDRAEESDGEEEPPEKKAHTESCSEDEQKCDPASDVTTMTVTRDIHNEDKKMTRDWLPDAKDGSLDVVVKSDLTNLKPHDMVATAETPNTTGQSSTSVKCNQSLQALFEAAHSELQNISKQDGDVASDAPVTNPHSDVVATKSCDLTSALKSGKIMIIKCDLLDKVKTAMPQFPQGVTIVEKGASELHAPLPVAVEFVTTEAQSDHIYGSMSGRDVSLKTNDDLSLVGSPMYAPPRMPGDTIVAMNVIVPMPSVVGRKRKHPPKPGKHICPYCSRGCAKPSVLQKHIRAHTGERPYPCAECGFSFKTKSNLYKHCKSRSHSIKAGLVPVATRGTVVDIAPKKDEPDVMETVEEVPVVEEVRMKRAFVPKRCVKETDQKPTSVASNTVFVLQPGVNAVGINPGEMSSHSVSGTSGKVIGDCQYYDVTFMTAEGALQTISLPVHAVPVVTKTEATTVAAPTMTQAATTVVTPTTSQVIVINNDATLAANLNSQVDGVGNLVKNIVVTSPIASECSMITSDAPVMSLVRQTPCTGSGRVRLTSSASLSGYPMPVSQVNQITPRSSLTPEMLHERITQLISSNAAIVDTPMADAPRPKRVSRHNSMYEPMLVIDGPMTSATVLPPEAAKKTPKLTHAKSDVSTFLGPVEHADQPPGSAVAGKSSVSASDSALSYTTAPNEIKIQIRLPKPPTTITPISSSIDVILPSIIRVGQRDGAPPPPTKVAAEHSVIKDLLLKGQPRSSPPPIVVHSTSVVGEVRWVDGMQSVSCTACRQTFRDTGSLEEHLKLCPGGGGAETCITTAPAEITSPAISCAVGLSTPSVKPQAVATTTGVSPTLPDVVDPSVPPKRGRPKGSRNSYNSIVIKPFPIPDAALFPSYPSLAPRPPMEPPSTAIKPPNRPPRPVLRLKIPPPHGFFPSHVTKGSQSAGVSPGSTSELPTTPITSFAKMKLKGKILMKRSISVERMLLQEKPMSAGVITGLSLTSCLQGAPLLRQKFPAGLRRCESLDESMPLAKRARLQDRQDSGKVDSLLYKMLMKGLIGPIPALNTANFMPTSIAEVKNPVIPATRKTEDGPPDVIIIDDGPESESSSHSGPSSTTRTFTYPPVNIAMTMPERTAVGKIAPFARGISDELSLHFSSIESLPDSIVKAIPCMPLRAVAGSERSSSSRLDSNETETITHHTANIKAKQEQNSTDVSVSMETSPARQDSKLVSNTMSQPLVASNKSDVVHLLLGHSFPILCNRSHATFCTVLKPQPIYIRQSNDGPSMYSNWQTTAADTSDNDELTSHAMLSLYQTRRNNRLPQYSDSFRQASVLTHSSYWNGVSVPPPAPPIVSAHRYTDSKPDPDMIALSEVEVTCENTSSSEFTAADFAVAHSSGRIVQLLHRDSTQSSVKPLKRVAIFSGGYKTNETYEYVRGRGRGHYVCERCGMRCKKPSMLKKHIRTHTDLRPYHCYYCSFSFKTKGNLTKHMKSKAHSKKCLELGIFPIPTTVDDSHVNPGTLDQQNQIAEENRMEAGDDLDESHVTDDNDDNDGDDDDDNDDEEDDSESETEMVIDDDAESVTSRSDVPFVVMVSDGSTENKSLESAALTETKIDDVTEGNTKHTDDVIGQPPRASIDKEIAASLLDLSKGTDDKMTSASAKSSLGPSSSSIGNSAGTGRTFTAVTRESVTSKHPMMSTALQAVSSDCRFTPVAAPSEVTPPLPSTVDHVTDRISPASRIWLNNMRSFSERTHTTLLPTTNEHDRNIGARFVPPLPPGCVVVRLAADAAKIAAVYPKFNSPSADGPIVGQFIKQDVSLASILSMTVTDTVSSAMAMTPTVTHSSTVNLQTSVVVTVDGIVSNSGNVGSAKISVDTDVAKQVHDAAPVIVELPTAAVVSSVAIVTTSPTTHPAQTKPTQTIPFHLLGLHGLPAVVPSEIPLGVLLVTTAGTTPSSSTAGATVVQFVTGDNRAPYEIVPIPGRVNDNSANLVDGKYVCNVCGKTFPRQHQLTLHKNIHYFERPFKCEQCSLSFRSKGHLDKHLKSEGHQVKVKASERSQAAAEAATSAPDNPRPFRCADCDIAFRIHGHLAKHLRSKMHVMTLERLGKVPPGAYALIEKNGSFKDVVAADCESSLQCIKQLLGNLEDGESPKDRDSSTPHIPFGSTQSDATDPGQTDCVTADSFVYCRAGEFEKVTNASNDRVIVERKSEMIDFREIAPEVDSSSGPTYRGRLKNRVRGTGPPEHKEHQYSLCSNSYTDISTLKRHHTVSAVTHTELRPHVCEYCDAGFTTSQSLTFHLRTHTQERPYLCGMCGATFTSLIHLQQHSTVHTSQSLDGATHPVAVTLASVVATLTNSRCGDVASNKRANSLSTLLPSNHGDAVDESASACHRDVEMTGGVETPLSVTVSMLTSIAASLPKTDCTADSALATSSATSADEASYPSSIAMLTAVPSDNRTSQTPLILGNKRRCLQRQRAMSGDEVTMTTVVTSASTDGSCVVTAAVDDATKYSNTLEHSHVGHDLTEQSDTCSSTVT